MSRHRGVRNKNAALSLIEFPDIAQEEIGGTYNDFIHARFFQVANKIFSSTLHIQNKQAMRMESQRQMGSERADVEL